MTENVRPTSTHKTLAEHQEALSPAEERFERARQTVGPLLGPLAFFTVYLLPRALDQGQQTLAARPSFPLVFWLSEAIPIPVMAGLRLAQDGYLWVEKWACLS